MNTSGECGCRPQLIQRQRITRYQGLHFHHHEIHALFEELIHRPWGTTRWNPCVDVWENKDTFVVEMDLPGVRAEETEIRAKDKTLVVAGQRRLRQDVSQAAAVLHERCEGKFARTFAFDFHIEEKDIETQWQEGVLTVVVRKPRQEGENEQK